MATLQTSITVNWWISARAENFALAHVTVDVFVKILYVRSGEYNISENELKEIINTSRHNL